jgi:hypothetical protein
MPTGGRPIKVGRAFPVWWTNCGRFKDCSNFDWLGRKSCIPLPFGGRIADLSRIHLNPPFGGRIADLSNVKHPLRRPNRGPPSLSEKRMLGSSRSWEDTLICQIYAMCSPNTSHIDKALCHFASPFLRSRLSLINENTKFGRNYLLRGVRAKFNFL